MMLLLILEEVLGDTAHQGATNCAQKAMTSFLAQEMATDAAADGAQ